MRNAKKIPALAFIALGAIASLQSCTKIPTLANALQYNLTLQSGSITVAIPPVSNTSSATTVDAGSNYINVDSFVKANTAGLLGVANVQSVRLTACSITMQNGSAANNFANFQSCSASFSSNSDSNPYQVGISDNPDMYSASITMPVDTTTEMKGYLTGNQFYYSVGGKMRRSTTDTLQCTIQFQFSVRVQG